MSQENTINTATLPPQETTAVDSDRLVTTYADTLMAGLFEDIDRLLEGDEAALVAIESGAKRDETTDEEEASPDLESSTPMADGVESMAIATPPTELDFFDSERVAKPLASAQPKSVLGKLFDRFLLASTALSLMGIVAFLWVNQRPATVDGAAANTQVSAGQSDAEFLNYLQRSLEAIAQKVEQREANAQIAPGQGTTLPMVPNTSPLFPSSGSGLGSPGGRINVVERIYIPYQTTQPASTTPVQPGVVGQTPLPTTPLPGATGTPVQPTQPATTPGVTHTLVGVLELGNRSAALFEINGVSQRVYIGERIGNAGWSLVSVSSQEVVIRRNGEVRSIYIGQQF